jgi:hypothetical protein
MGKVIVIVNDDVSQTLNGTFQVRLGSFESGSEFFIGNVVAALADAHGNSRDRLLGVSLGLVPTLPGRVELRAFVARVGPSSPTLLLRGRRMKAPRYLNWDFRKSMAPSGLRQRLRVGFGGERDGFGAFFGSFREKMNYHKGLAAQR